MNIYDLFSDQEKSILKEAQEDPAYSTSTKNEYLRIKFAEKIKNNFAYLVYILGYRDLGGFHRLELERIAAKSHLESHPVRRLWLWSRGFFKTSLITEAHSIYLILNNPDIRILIVSYSLEVAKKPLGAIRNHFISNEDFRGFFKEYCPKPNKEGKIEWGTTEAITVPNRTKNFKEPTIMCAGIGTNITGLHFDWMKIDDLVNRDSVTNDVQIQSSKDYYSLLRPIFDNPVIPREDVIGTIYNFADLHSDLSKNPDFEKSIIPAINDRDEFVFPERLNKEGWEKMLMDPSINTYDIQRQWLLRPVDPKDAKFKESWIKYYNETPENMAEYICVDPASTQKKKSDYTVIERWGVDSAGKHYLLEASRDRMTAFERIDKLFQFVKNSSNLKWVKYEVLGGRHGDLEVIRERQAKLKIFFMVKETKSTTSGKSDRIEQRLVGPYYAGIIHLPERLFYKSNDGTTHDFSQEMKMELLQFPNTLHDDIIDCQSQMFEEELIKGKDKAKETRKFMTASDWEKYYDDMDNLKKSNPFATDEWVKYKMRKKILMRA